VVIQDTSDEVDKLAEKTESLAGMYSATKSFGYSLGYLH
jgi:hypothetical protein